MDRALLAAVLALVAALGRGQVGPGRVLVATRQAAGRVTLLLEVDPGSGAVKPLSRFASDSLPPLGVLVDPVNRDAVVAVRRGQATRVLRLRLQGLAVAGVKLLAALPGVATTMLFADGGDLFIGFGGAQGRLVRLPRNGGTARTLATLPRLAATVRHRFFAQQIVALQSGRATPFAAVQVRVLDARTGKTLRGPIRFPAFRPLQVTGITDIPTALVRQVLSGSDGSLYESLFFGPPKKIPLVPQLPAGAAAAIHGMLVVLGGKAHPFLKTFLYTGKNPMRWKNLAGPLPGDPVDFDFAAAARAQVVGFGRACPNAARFRAGWSGSPVLGAQRFFLRLSQGPPAAAVALGLGATERRFLGLDLPLPLPGGCKLLVAPAVLGGAVTDGRGSAMIRIPIPQDSRLAGTIFYGQWFRPAGAGLDASGASAVHVR